MLKNSVKLKKKIPQLQTKLSLNGKLTNLNKRKRIFDIELTKFVEFKKKKKKKLKREKKMRIKMKVNNGLNILKKRFKNKKIILKNKKKN